MLVGRFGLKLNYIVEDWYWQFIDLAYQQKVFNNKIDIPIIFKNKDNALQMLKVLNEEYKYELPNNEVNNNG